jgi:glycosyltransferase involved in cell wall biosynthesis
MKILFVIDYNVSKRVLNGFMPSHHIFGIYDLIDHFTLSGSAVLKEVYVGGGKVDFLVAKRSVKSAIAFFIKAQRYDVVYDVLNVFSKYWGLMNGLRLFRPKLVTIMHHPPFDKQLKYAKSDVSIFFTNELLELARKDVKDNRKMVANYWYPDTDWYNKMCIGMDTTKIYDFLDNGKTARDHDKFIHSMELMPDKRGVIVTDKNHIPKSYKEGGNVDLFFQDKPNDVTMLQLCLQCRVMVIPLIGKADMLGPIGYTSYMDAIATGMPVVTTDNSAFAKETLLNKLGYVYPHDVDEFSSVLQQSLDNYDKLHQRMIEFATSHTIHRYSEVLISLFEQL